MVFRRRPGTPSASPSQWARAGQPPRSTPSRRTKHPRRPAQNMTSPGPAGDGASRLSRRRAVERGRRETALKALGTPLDVSQVSLLAGNFLPRGRRLAPRNSAMACPCRLCNPPVADRSPTGTGNFECWEQGIFGADQEQNRELTGRENEAANPGAFGLHRPRFRPHRRHQDEESEAASRPALPGAGEAPRPSSGRPLRGRCREHIPATMNPFRRRDALVNSLDAGFGSRVFGRKIAAGEGGRIRRLPRCGHDREGQETLKATLPAVVFLQGPLPSLQPCRAKPAGGAALMGRPEGRPSFDGL
jgi:hypothetical protein